MVPVEMSRGDVVEAVIIDPRQPVGAVGIGPDPGLESGFDPGELLLGCLGIYDIENAPFAIALLDDVEDLRHAAVERIGNELAGMPAVGAPFGRAGRHVAELPGVDRP